MYVATGNGTFSQGSPLELGDSIVKFNFGNGVLSVADYFTPFNQNTLSIDDDDLGSGGVLLLPDQPRIHPHLLVEAGKAFKIYLVDRDQMTTNNTHYCSGCNSDSEIVQENTFSVIGRMYGMPAYWNNNVYFWGVSDVLKSIPLSNGLLNFTHITSSIESVGFPGATPSISANGTSNGIIWAIDSSQYLTNGPAVLHAHDATNVANELWNSTQAANNRDKAGSAVKFTVPTIANGKVYIGTQTEVDVYGLLSESGVGVQLLPISVNLSASQTQQFTATVTGTTNTGVTWSMSPAVGTLSTTGLYTAPSSISVAQTINVTATSQADTTQFATASVNLQPPAGTFAAIRVHAGGGAYTDSLGQSWSADTGFIGGNTYSTANSISNTPDPALYQTERWGSFSYNFTVPNGTYNVILKFAEIYWSSAGQRIFGVSINGAPVLTNFDIVAQAGAAFKALDKTFSVTVTNGAITIQFIAGTVDHPKVSAIEIH